MLLLMQGMLPPQNLAPGSARCYGVGKASEVDQIFTSASCATGQDRCERRGRAPTVHLLEGADKVGGHQVELHQVPGGPQGRAPQVLWIPV